MIDVRNTAESTVLTVDLLELVSDLVQIARPDGTLLFVNRSWRDALGYTSDEIAQLTDQDIIHPSDRERRRDRLRRVLAGEVLEQVETVLACKDGVPLVVEGNLSCRFENGRAVAVRDVVRVVREPSSSDREEPLPSVRAREELRRSEERLRAIVETEPECIKVVAADGTLLQMNAAGLAMVEASSWESVQGICVFELIAPEHRESYREFHRRICEGGRGTLEFDIIGLLGTRRRMHTHAVPIRFAQDGPAAALGITQDITERKRSEEALVRAEAKYRGIFENAIAGIYQSTPNGRIVTANPMLARILGHSSPEELLRFVAENDHFFYADPTRRAEFVRRIEEDGAVVNFESEIVRRDGSRGWISENTRPLLDESGVVIGYEGTLVDITEQKRAEQSLREQTQILDTLNEVGKVLAAELNLDRLVQAIADAGVRLSGAKFGAFFYNALDDKGEAYLLHTLSGAPREAFAGFPMPRNTDVFRLTFEGKGNVRLDDVTQDPRYGRNDPFRGMPEGHLPVRSYLAVPVVSRSGNVLGGLFFGHVERAVFGEQAEQLIGGLAAAASVALDNAHLFQAVQTELAERRQAEQALRESRELFDSFMRHSPAIAFIKSDDDRLLYVNAAFEDQIWDGHPPDWRNRTGEELWPAEMARQLRANDLRILQSGQAEVVEEAVVKPDGVQTFLSFKFPLRQPSGIHCLAGMAINITERKRAEEEHRRLETQLLHAQKLESLGVLAGGIAHDFNNLLTSMLGYSELALMELPAESNARPMVHEIEKAALRAAELAAQMLAYSGRGKFVIRTIRLDDLVREMTALLGTVVSKKAQLQLDLLPAAIEGDASQIRQVVMNLITNASDSLDGACGAIRVRTGTRHATAAQLRSTYLPEDVPEGEYAYVEVADDGCGMTPETLARIFDPFFTTKFTGRGLGLAAVLGIVKSHHGSITVESEPGGGTTFRVFLPATGSTEDANETPTRRPQARSGSAILIVDDEEGVRGFARNVLERAGFHVREAKDGREGLELFQRYVGEISAVLLDFTMPRMDGVEVLREMRKLRPSVPILMMSGYSDLESAAHLTDAEACGFIQKPFQPGDLVQRLSSLLRAAAGTGQIEPHR